MKENAVQLAQNVPVDSVVLKRLSVRVNAAQATFLCVWKGNAALREALRNSVAESVAKKGYVQIQESVAQQIVLLVAAMSAVQ